MRSYKTYSDSTVNVMDDENELIPFNGKFFARCVVYFPSFSEVNKYIEHDYLYNFYDWNNTEGEVLFTPFNPDPR